MMTFKKTLIAGSVAAVTLGLAGCGGDSGQDTSTPSSTSFTGLVVDGRIAGGLVWEDANQNGALDTFEKYATTDYMGYYTYNPETQENYCADTSHIHCLNSGMSEGDILIRIAGGLDLDTYEPFNGVLTVKTSRDEARQAESNIINNKVSKDDIDDESKAFKELFALISPLTSLLSKLDENDYATVMSNLLGENVDTAKAKEYLRKDFSLSNVDEDNGGSLGSVEQKLLKAAYKVQKIVDSLSAGIDEKAKANNVKLGGTATKPAVASSSDFVAEELLKKVKTKKLDDLGSGDFEDINNNASTSLVSKLSAQTGETVDVTKVKDDDSVQQAAQMALRVKEVLTSKLDSVTSTTDLTEFKAATVAAQIIVNKAKDSAKKLANGEATRSTLETQAANIAGIIKDTNIVSNMKTTLGSKTVEVSTLLKELDKVVEAETGVKTYNTSDDFSTNVANASIENIDTGIWAGKSLVLSGGKEGDNKGRAWGFFQGNGTQKDGQYISGDATLCLAYNYQSSSKTDIYDVFTGTWSQVGDNKGVISIVSPETGVRFLLKAVTASVAASGIDADDRSLNYDGGINVAKFRFDYDGDVYNWYSEESVAEGDWGMRDYSTIPANFEQCKTQFQISKERAFLTNVE